MRVYERFLVPHVIRHFRGRGYLVFTEQYAGLGRADVVAVMLDMDEVERRVKHDVPHLPVRTFLRIMRVLGRNGGVASIDYLARRLGLTAGYVRRVVGFAEPIYLRREGVYVRKVGDYRSFTSEVILIEVKVRDWRAGLIQAHSYLMAGHKSYLAIHNRNYRRIPEEVTAWARNNGIGILTVGVDGAVKEVIPARAEGPKSMSAHYTLIESLWDKIIKQLKHY